MPELPLLVVVDNVFVLVHAADSVEAAAAKVADVRPDLVVRVTDVKLLLGKHFIVRGCLRLRETARGCGLCETGFLFC